MSVQFGRWNIDGKPLDPGYLEQVNSVVAPYGPDDSGSYTNGDITILFHALHTTSESMRETQPHVAPHGAVITWDGRLDNRSELIRDLPTVLAGTATDVEIVAAAYEQWGTNCFSKLLGDWALAIWHPTARSLLLARDFVGLRPLYYSFDEDQIAWSTILDPLVLFAGKRFPLCEEYIAGWLSLFPATHLTPYLGIHSVPPASFVLLRVHERTVSKYWDFDPSKNIRYRTDSEYEEHFRNAFAEAVRRRLRSAAPVLAELSGGMDSSSVVCVADPLLAHESALAPRLDTVSYFSNSEPNWNERPYFTQVEEKRGRIGLHIDFSAQGSVRLEFDSNHFAATPSAGVRSNKAADDFAAYLTSQGYRVLLSGIAGDEILGGVPTPTPELADSLAKGRWRALAHQLRAWALSERKPWHLLLFETAKAFAPAVLAGMSRERSLLPWLRPDFRKHHRTALAGFVPRLRLFGPLPSMQQNLTTLELLRRRVGCFPSHAKPPFEKRYPYLDRDLLEFAYAIPRDQILRPGQRRSLMRRALAGIVPEQVLARRRKAFVVRAPLAALATNWNDLSGLSRRMISSSLGIVDPRSFGQALQKARHGEQVAIVSVMRTLCVEFWLQNVLQWNCLSVTCSAGEGA